MYIDEVNPLRALLPFSLLIALFAALAAPSVCTAADDPLSAAQTLLLRGRYAEAAERFTALAEKHPTTASVGLARALSAVGKSDQAIALLESAAQPPDIAAEVHAELAALRMSRGNLEGAREAAAAALAADENCLQARWLQAELHRLTGELAEAQAGYEWLTERYNAQPPTDARSLHWIGLGAAQLARWQRLSEQFRFLVNELYPDALQADANYWPAHYEAGQLYLEKYNRADAAREFEAALKINPSAAEVHAAVAQLHLNDFEFDAARKAIQRALEVNPQLLAARLLQADLQLANFEVESAWETLQLALPLDPHSEETLGRMAAIHVLRDGDAAETPGGACAALQDKVLARNPHAGEFCLRVANVLETQRQFPAAERWFQEAIAVMPQLIGSQAGLGMLYMRLGREREARVCLTAAFEADPFHVRVKNMLEVLDVLDGYATAESEHFILRYHAEHDAVFARYALEHLERVYAELCPKLGYTPSDKSLFEIFSKARNTDGHGWFSARTVGLPYVGTVGACTGKMVAVTSPHDGKRSFNWARVLKHEFVHVLNLAQTNFHIPHWFTEAIAVWNEGYPRPDEWNKLLAERVPARKLFNLDNINLGFVRPQSGQEWQLAYCQSELYVEHMLAEHGEDAVLRMLSAYAQNKTTRQALTDALGTTQEDFERGYLERLDRVTAALGDGAAAAPPSFSELERQHAAEPNDAEVAAQLALAHVERKNYPAARRLVDSLLTEQPKHGLGSYVRARLHLVVGEDRQALAALEQGLDQSAPDPRLLGLLAALKLKARAFDEADVLYQLGAQRWPHDPAWQKRLAKLYLEAGRNDRLAETLATLAELDAEDFTIRKKLVQLALSRGDAADAVRWSQRALEINVLDSTLHRMYAQALAAQGQHDAASREWATLVELAPDDLDARCDLAQAYRQAGRLDEARAACQQILDEDPTHARAAELLRELSP